MLQFVNKNEKVFLSIMGAIFLFVVLVPLFFVINPKERRAQNLDSERLNKLANISSEINTYFNDKKTLPLDLTFISDPLLLVDPETGAAVVYNKKLYNKYELCMTFSTDSSVDSSYYPSKAEPYYPSQTKHKKGYDCLQYTVN